MDYCFNCVHRDNCLQCFHECILLKSINQFRITPPLPTPLTACEPFNLFVHRYILTLLAVLPI